MGRDRAPTGFPSYASRRRRRSAARGDSGTPEHLFVLAASACWLTTFLAVAATSKLDVAAVDCGGEGTLEQDEDHRFRISSIVLRPRVTVHREDERDRALRLAMKAETLCLIRNSIRTEVTLEPEILVGEDALVHP